jgi:putative copper resistance protein D
MSWFGSEIDEPLVLTRAIHFAATATTAGALIFRGLVAEPALGGAPSAAPLLESRSDRWRGSGSPSPWSPG